MNIIPKASELDIYYSVFSRGRTPKLLLGVSPQFKHDKKKKGTARQRTKRQVRTLAFSRYRYPARTIHIAAGTKNTNVIFLFTLFPFVSVSIGC